MQTHITVWQIAQAYPEILFWGQQPEKLKTKLQLIKELTTPSFSVFSSLQKTGMSCSSLLRRSQF